MDLKAPEACKIPVSPTVSENSVSSFQDPADLAPVDAAWEEFKDDKGRFFYWNHVTKKSKWKPPPFFKPFTPKPASPAPASPSGEPKKKPPPPPKPDHPFPEEKKEKLHTLRNFRMKDAEKMVKRMRAESIIGSQVDLNQIRMGEPLWKQSRTKPPQYRFVYHCIFWAPLPLSTNTLQPKFLKLEDVIKLQQGKHTYPLNRPHMESVPHEHCFSVVFADRTLNFQCQSSEQRMRWFSGLKAAIFAAKERQKRREHKSRTRLPSTVVEEDEFGRIIDIKRSESTENMPDDEKKQFVDDHDRIGSNVSAAHDRVGSNMSAAHDRDASNLSAASVVSAAPKLAYDWTEYTDADGAKYYYNHKTRQSVWDPPSGYEEAKKEAQENDWLSESEYEEPVLPGFLPPSVSNQQLLDDVEIKSRKHQQEAEFKLGPRRRSSFHHDRLRKLGCMGRLAECYMSPALGLLFNLMFLGFFGVTYYTLYTYCMEIDDNWDTFQIISLIYVFLPALLLFLSYFRTLFTGPGYVMKGWENHFIQPSILVDNELFEFLPELILVSKEHHSEHAHLIQRRRGRSHPMLSQEVSIDGEVQQMVQGDHSIPMDEVVREMKLSDHCIRCGFDRPKRAHHCLHCDKCILRYSHHSSWINTCIGDHNYKYFLLTVLYLLITSIIGMITIAGRLYEIADKIESTEGILYAVSVFGMVWAFLIALTEIRVHAPLMRLNMTPIEDESSQVDWVTAEFFSLPIERTHIYNFGLWDNMILLFGHRLWAWFLPIKVKYKSAFADVGGYLPLWHELTGHTFAVNPKAVDAIFKRDYMIENMQLIEKRLAMFEVQDFDIEAVQQNA